MEEARVNLLEAVARVLEANRQLAEEELRGQARRPAHSVPCVLALDKKV